MNQDQLREALESDGCERLKDFYNVGPVQRAAVESFVAAITATQQAAPEYMHPVAILTKEVKPEHWEPQQAAPSQVTELPQLPEGKCVVRGPASAFNNPESGSLVDFDCEGPLSHCPEDGEELFTADQMQDYARDALLEASTQREQPAQAMQRWQIMPTVRVRSTNQELSVTGVYEDVVFVDLPEQQAGAASTGGT